MSRMVHNFYDGKYTVIYDDTESGSVDFRALRHGQEWCRSLVGDGLVLAMLQDFDELKTIANEFLADVVSAGETDEIINRFPSFGKLYDIARFTNTVLENTEKGGLPIGKKSKTTNKESGTLRDVAGPGTFH